MSSSAGADGPLVPLPAGAAAKSPVSTGMSERGVKPPPPPGASSRPPRNCTASAMMSTDWRLLPSLSSHSRHSRRPSIATGRPFERYRAEFSPWAPQTVTSKKFGLSTHSPVELSLRRVLQATRSLQTDVPLGSERSSGSDVRFPVMITRLMFVAAIGGGSFRGRTTRKLGVGGECRGALGRHPHSGRNVRSFVAGSTRGGRV
jgi:hypothetical protein